MIVYYYNWIAFSHRRSWHGFATPLFSNFLFTNLFSIKFLYFFIISSHFPYFNLFVSIFIQSYVNIKLHVSTLIDTNNQYLYRVYTCNLMLTFLGILVYLPVSIKSLWADVRNLQMDFLYSYLFTNVRYFCNVYVFGELWLPYILVYESRYGCSCSWVSGEISSAISMSVFWFSIYNLWDDCSLF